MAALPPGDPSCGTSGLSQRSVKLASAPLSYIGKLIHALPNLWHPESNPEGWIPLVVAENKLMGAPVLEKLAAVTDFPPAVMNYGSLKGIPALQHALATVMERTFLQGYKLDPGLLVAQAGCGSILDHLFFCLCDAEEGVLIPAPYYPAFDNDLTAKDRVQPLPFYLDETEANGSIAEQLDRAVAEGVARGTAVRALLITNPNNPLGTIYSDATLTAMLRWCLQRKVHYVSDEIYALSVFKPTPFTSALMLAQRLLAEVAEGATPDGGVPAAGASAAPEGSAPAEGSVAGTAGGIMQQDVDSYLHLVYGLSKDWCGSGLRVGILYSQNMQLQESLGSIAIFGGISNHTQYALAKVLGDLDWAEGFIKQNKAALEASYDLLVAALDKHSIRYSPAVAGMFVWVDLRQWLPEQTWAGERQLWEGICNSSKVILTPGFDCHAAAPGFFRLCFAWMPPAALDVAVERLAAQFASPRTCMQM